MEALFRWIWGHWRAIHEESLAAAQPAPPTGRGRKQVPAAAIAMPLDWKPIVILITTALTLTLQEYAGDRNVFARLVDKGWVPYHPAPEYWELWSFVWWTGW
jgi:hypothetical protein